MSEFNLLLALHLSFYGVLGSNCGRGEREPGGVWWGRGGEGGEDGMGTI